ncbi:hypothetical protein [Kibdelosporangium aridum]|uniref:hypothetical protein n=1 Tax=Kibdelosporangium aridum TaxID=2030 RepID=UPI0035E53BC4
MAIVVAAVLLIGGAVTVVLLTTGGDKPTSTASGNTPVPPPPSGSKPPPSGSKKPGTGNVENKAEVEAAVTKVAQQYADAMNRQDAAAATQLTCKKADPGVVYETAAGKLEATVLHVTIYSATRTTVNLGPRAWTSGERRCRSCRRTARGAWKSDLELRGRVDQVSPA